MFRRPLGSARGFATVMSRRGRRPRRPEDAIERLEERVLLSAATYDRFENVQAYRLGGSYGGSVGDSAGGGWLQGLPAGEVAAAYVFWQGVDLVGEGGDGAYDYDTVTFDGVEHRATRIGTGDTSGRGPGAAAKYRIDVTEALRERMLGSHILTGLAARPGHRLDQFELILLLRSAVQTGGVGGATYDVASGNNGIDRLDAPATSHHLVLPTPSNASFLALTDESGVVSFRTTHGPIIWRSDFYEIVTQPPVGELETHIDEGGAERLRYRPAEGFSGEVTFRYRLRIGNAYSDPATGTITVRPDSPAVAGSLDFTVRSDGPFTGFMRGEDADTEAYTFEVVDPPSVGMFSYAAQGGRFIYTPPDGFHGPVEFTYRLRQGNRTSETARVRLEVIRTRAADLDVTIYTREGGRTSTRMSGSNGRSFDRYELVSPPAVGAVEFSPGAVDGVKYRPPEGFAGEVTFTYRAWDGSAWSTMATVRVTVVPDTAPVVADLGLTAQAGETLRGWLPASDAEGDPLTYAVDSPPGFDWDPLSGAFVYTPPAGFTGTVTFRYGVFSQAEQSRWGHGWSDTATLTITVAPPRTWRRRCRTSDSRPSRLAKSRASSPDMTPTTTLCRTRS